MLPGHMGRTGIPELASTFPVFSESVKPIEEVALFVNDLPKEVDENNS